MLLLSTSVRCVVSQGVWALCFFFFSFLTAISLGFILLIKFFFLRVSFPPQTTSQVWAEMQAGAAARKRRAFILAFLIGTTGR